MNIVLDPHAEQRVRERGASIDEIWQTVEGGSRVSTRKGRWVFTKEFKTNGMWLDRSFDRKSLEVVAVDRGEDWLVITVIVRYHWAR